MKIFRCRICGEVYVGREIPHTCPFCGVNKKYLVLGNIWKDENQGLILSEVSKNNLEEALKIELSNVSFYQCISKTSTNGEISSMFKGLFKVEREHASLFQKLLKFNTVAEINEKCVDDVIDSLNDSLKREAHAIEFYTKALSEATEPRLKDIFGAILEVEKDHLELDNEMKKKYK